MRQDANQPLRPWLDSCGRDGDGGEAGCRWQAKGRNEQAHGTTARAIALNADMVAWLQKTACVTCSFSFGIGACYCLLYCTDEQRVEGGGKIQLHV